MKMNTKGKVDKDSIGNWRKLSKKILSLQVVSQPLPMRNMLKQVREWAGE